MSHVFILKMRDLILLSDCLLTHFLRGFLLSPCTTHYHSAPCSLLLFIKDTNHIAIVNKLLAFLIFHELNLLPMFDLGFVQDFELQGWKSLTNQSTFKLTLQKFFIILFFSLDIFFRLLWMVLEFLLFKWMFTFTLTLKETFKSWHLREHIFKFSNLLLGKFLFACFRGALGLFKLWLSHLLHIMSIDIFIFSFTEIFLIGRLLSHKIW